jgi:hypothetical protein
MPGNDNAFPGRIKISVQGFQLFAEGDVQGVIFFAGKGLGQKAGQADEHEHWDGQKTKVIFFHFT